MEEKEMIKKSDINLYKIINIIVFVLFIIISLVVGAKHEPWADEAQSWLIARDNSFLEILKVTRLEGTPCLWTMILKIFISLGLQYENFYFVSILFSTIGVYLLLFKLDIPQELKVLLPFTYFIMYQFNIVSRSYCLILPILCFITIIYNKKQEKPLLYALSLILLMGISSHTYLMSGSLFLGFLYELYTSKKINRNIIISIAILIISYIITLIFVFPTGQGTFESNGGKDLFVVISNSLFSMNMKNNLIDEIISIVLIVTLVKNYDFKKHHVLPLFLISPLIICVIIHAEIWHFGIFFLALLFYCIINDLLYNNKWIYYMFLCCCVIQIFWSITTGYCDYMYTCSPNEELVSYLKEINAEDKIVYGLGYNVIELNPYFEKNIFDNYREEKAYYNWNKQNNCMTYEEMKQTLPDVIVGVNYYYNYLSECEENYNKRVFYSYVFSKGEKYIDNSIVVYTKIE